MNFTGSLTLYLFFYIWALRPILHLLVLKKGATMKIAVMKEMHEGETRVPLIPATVDKLIKLGAEVEIESGLGLSCRFTDADYEKVGAKINPDRKVMLQSADIILRLRKPPIDEIDMMKEGESVFFIIFIILTNNKLHICFLELIFNFLVPNS